MSDKRLTDKVAIVTGGGRGLGREMVLALANAGAKVVATAARDHGEVERVAAEAAMQVGSECVLALRADVTNPDVCSWVVESALGQFHGLHILVNNAGRGMKFVSADFLTKPTRFWETSPDLWRLVIDTNVNGPFFMTRAAVPQMIEQEHGRIINITMNHETMRRKGFSPYGPSKAALESETIIWAQDLHETGVTVNGLLPGGAVDTGMIPDDLPANIRKRLLDPKIIVPPLLWLASDASAGITGRRFVANRWSHDLDEESAAHACEDCAGWV
jgi:3-oxoacyl-[acyl-carrier protein] reductase